jgi:hypothetical protein
VQVFNIHLNVPDNACDAHWTRQSGGSRQHLMRATLIVGATGAPKNGATVGATTIAILFQKVVAMQENPVDSTILPVA